DFPAAVRQSLHQGGHPIPVMAVCRCRTLHEAEAALQAGHADLVGMARAHVAEPAIVKKTIVGRQDEIRPCINCNQGCAGMLEKNIAIRCLANPRTGLESRWPETEALHKASRPGRIIVVGGGPGGMEAAAELAALGHSVQLWEANTALGGNLRHAAALTHRSEWERLLTFQRNRL